MCPENIRHYGRTRAIRTPPTIILTIKPITTRDYVMPLRSN